MTSYGYIRTSTREQNSSLQRDAMAAAGIEKIFADEGVSGTLADRPELELLKRVIGPSDEVVVWKLDRAGRNTRNVLDLIEYIESKGATFRSLTEGISTSGPMGRAMVTIMSAFAQLERDTIVERTTAGLASAKEKGRVGGRPSKLTPAKVDKIKVLLASEAHSRREVAEMMKISEATLYRVIQTL